MLQTCRIGLLIPIMLKRMNEWTWTKLINAAKLDSSSASSGVHEFRELTSWGKALWVPRCGQLSWTLSLLRCITIFGSPKLYDLNVGILVQYLSPPGGPFWSGCSESLRLISWPKLCRHEKFNQDPSHNFLNHVLSIQTPVGIQKLPCESRKKQTPYSSQ